MSILPKFKSEILKQILLPNQVHLPDAQQAKHWDAKFAAGKGLFMKQPSEETGEEISDPPPEGEGSGYLQDKEAGWP